MSSDDWALGRIEARGVTTLAKLPPDASGWDEVRARYFAPRPRSPAAESPPSR